MHEDFVATVYPQVHENLKLTTKEQVHIQNPSNSSGTLSSLKNLEGTFTYGDQFLNDKSTEVELGKTNVDTEVQSMVNVPIHQAVPPLSIPIIDLSPPKPSSTSVQELIIIATTTTTILPLLPPPPTKRMTYPDLDTRFSTLEMRSVDFEQKYKLQDKTIQALRSRPPIQKSSAWKTSDTKEGPFSSSKQKPASQSEQPINDDPIPEDVNLSESEDTDWVIPPNDLPKTKNNWVDTLAKTYKDPEDNKLLWKTGDIASFIKWYCKQTRKKKLIKADFEGQAYKVVRPFHKNNISLQFLMEECHLLLTDQIDLMNPEGNRVVYDVNKPLPLGGPPGQIIIQPQYFFNKDLKYLVSGDKERRHALSISKLKAAYYPDFRLEELVPNLWAKSEREYDISAAYGISHYGYTYLKEIILRRADYNEYKISEADFKNLHPNDFEDLNLLHLQGKLDHLSGADKVHLSTAVNLWTRNIVIRQRVEDLQLRIKSYQTKLNLTQLRWDLTNFLFKEDYTIVHKLRAVIYRDRKNQKKMMWETDVHKFNDGTLTRILEKLDYMVKDYKLVKFNPGMENRI
ncbi:hypothetical protein Tco_0918868 [Tanacetum coccineum]